MAEFNSSLPVRTENNGDVVIKICDPTTTSQAASVTTNSELVVTVTDASGTPVDPRAIRALTALTDEITVVQGDNGSLANAWPVIPTDGTNPAAYTAAGEALVKINSALPTGSNTIGAVTQASGPWTMDLTRVGGTSISLGQAAMIGSIPVVLASNQTEIPINVQDGSGNPITSGAQSGSIQALDVELAVNGAILSTANPLPVVISNSTPGTEVMNYQTTNIVAGGASVTHTYTVTGGKELTLQQVAASASGKMKIEILLDNAVKVVLFNSTANPNVDYIFFNPQKLAAAKTVKVTATNLDKQDFSFYSTIEGVEV